MSSSDDEDELLTPSRHRAALSERQEAGRTHTCSLLIQVKPRRQSAPAQAPAVAGAAASFAALALALDSVAGTECESAVVVSVMALA